MGKRKTARRQVETPKALPANQVQVTKENASLILCKQIEILSINVAKILQILSEKK